jgi:transmembrane sensor
VLSPGQRLRVANVSEKVSKRLPEKAADGPPKSVIDTPHLEKITAWQRGQVVFEDTPLNEAVTEFNRYSETKIQLDGADLDHIRVGGTFKVGDIASFVEAIAAYHHLQVIANGREVVLTR